MRKDCRIWQCQCGLQFKSRAKFYEHRKSCSIYQSWRCECYKRSAATRKNRYGSMTCEERELERQKRRNAQKKYHSPEYRKAASERAVFNNFWKYRSKNPIIYESPIAGKVKLDSKWELKVAQRLDDLKVEWYRSKIRLPYFDLEGVEHGYFPDFYVKTYNCFIEVKSDFIANYQSSQDKVSYIKEHYKFIKWLQTEEACETFTLEDLGCDLVPKKDEESVDFWLQKVQKNKNKKSNKTKNDILREERLSIIQNCDIDFSKFGWVSKLSKLFNISENKAGKYVKDNFPDFYKTCYKRKRVENKN